MTVFAKSNWAPGEPEDRPKTIPISESDFKTLPSKNPNQAFIIGNTERPGFSPFMVETEYTLYTPDTPENAKFELMTSNFPPETDMLWFTIIIPLEDLDKVREVAKKYKFEFVKGSTPIAVDDKAAHVFPLESGPNVFSISGFLEDAQLVQKMWDHWKYVIDAHAQDLPWGPFK